MANKEVTHHGCENATVAFTVPTLVQTSMRQAQDVRDASDEPACDYTEHHAQEDEEMSKNTYPLKLPTSVKNAAAELAANDGVSLNQFIAAAVAEKVGALRAAEDLLRERAGKAKPKDMLKYLRRAPKVEPNADDMP
jgi:predicted HicB family RNase H-like nuclease